VRSSRSQDRAAPRSAISFALVGAAASAALRESRFDAVARSIGTGPTGSNRMLDAIAERIR
jgi:hypothetical protein